jgi:hypothetical protein
VAIGIQELAVDGPRRRCRTIHLRPEYATEGEALLLDEDLNDVIDRDGVRIVHFVNAREIEVFAGGQQSQGLNRDDFIKLLFMLAEFDRKILDSPISFAGPDDRVYRCLWRDLILEAALVQPGWAGGSRIGEDGLLVLTREVNPTFGSIQAGDTFL